MHDDGVRSSLLVLLSCDLIRADSSPYPASSPPPLARRLPCRASSFHPALALSDGTMMCTGKMRKPEMLKGEGMVMLKEFGWGMYERNVMCPAGTKLEDCKVSCMDG